MKGEGCRAEGSGCRGQGVGGRVWGVGCAGVFRFTCLAQHILAHKFGVLFAPELTGLFREAGRSLYFRIVGGLE